MSILDHVDADDLEARLRAGQFQSLENFYDWIESSIGFRPDKNQARIIKQSLFPAERAIVASLAGNKKVSTDPDALRERQVATNRRNYKPRKRGTPKVVLTVQDVLDIRASFKEDGGTFGWQSQIARAYGVRPNTINDIIKRRTWREV